MTQPDRLPTSATDRARRIWHSSKIRLAGIYRRALRNVCFVGVTGSYSKTTTVELLAEILNTRGRVRKGSAVTNPPHRVAGTILTTLPWHRFFVHELGGFEPGVLAAATAVMKPRVGIVTAVANDHYSAFQGLDATAKEKGTLVSALPADGIAVLNADDCRVLGMRALTQARIVTYGFSDQAVVRGGDVSGAWPEPLSLTVAHKGERARIRTNLFGEQWALGVLAALAAGLALDVPLRDGAAAIGKVHPIEGRMSPLTTPDRITFIQDTWKSPLHSIPLVLQFLQNARARRKVLLIGSISDFPGRADRKYRDVARQARTVTDKVLFVGRWAHYGLKGRSNPDDDRILAFKNLYLANTFLRDYLLPGDLVMLKGSNRNDHLERVVLDRTRKIACWRVDCRRRMHCSDCRLRNSSFIPV